MKKGKYFIIILLILLLGTSLWFYGYYSRKSNDNLPSKEMMVTYYAEKGEDYATEKLSGYKNTQLREVWGKPDGSLFGFWGDIWETGSHNNLIVYYDSKGIVRQVKVERSAEKTKTYEASVENGVLCSYCETGDGKWICNDRIYEYRLEIQGRMPNAARDSVFVYLSNLPEISFEKAFMAAGYSSHSEDSFSPEEAVLVEMRTE